MCGSSAAHLCGDAVAVAAPAPEGRPPATGSAPAPPPRPPTPAPAAAAAPPPPPPRRAARVVVNTYHLIRGEENERWDTFGIGFYHCGIEVHGTEWSYGGYHNPGPGVPDRCGIFTSAPRAAMAKEQFHKAVELGVTALTQAQVRRVVKSLERSWQARGYHILARNCNHFCEELVRALGAASGCEYRFPDWANRAARIGDMLIPDSVLCFVLAQVRALPPPAAPGSGAGRRAAADPAAGPVPPAAELRGLPVRRLRALMAAHRIDPSGCIEKGDLVERIDAYRAARAPDSS